jgi:hypothetical protein
MSITELLEAMGELHGGLLQTIEGIESFQIKLLRYNLLVLKGKSGYNSADAWKLQSLLELLRAVVAELEGCISDHNQ